ncbi:MAG: HTH domain-containing protein, partial [Acidobacteriales bacterium]|nr:HTH domain-containing protein [Terriglobales bacterium]
IPAEGSGENGERDKTRRTKRGFKGTQGLGPKKTDLSQYMNKLTQKQQLALSLKYEYELPVTEIASRMEVDRKTVYEHIDAAERKIAQIRSAEKGKVRRMKSPEEP